MAPGMSLFSVLAVSLYLLAIGMSVRAALVARAKSGGRDSRFWLASALLFGLLIVSRLFGVEAALTENLRSELKALALYRGRAEIQGIVASVVVVTVAAVIALWIWLRTRTPWREVSVAGRYRMAAEVACGAMVCLVMLRVVSLHIVDSLLFRGPHLNWLVDVGATVAIIACSAGFSRALGDRSQAARSDEAAHRRRKL